MQRLIQSKPHKQFNMGCQKLENNKKYCAFFTLFLICTFIAGGILIVSAIPPQFHAQTKEITFGDVFSDYSTSVIPLDDTISSIKLNLIQQVHLNSGVNISISSMKPTKSSIIGHKSFEQVYMLTFGTFFRSGYNYLGLDEPIYLLPESTLTYQIDAANTANIRLCIFNDSLVYAHFLSDYSYKYTSCFNATCTSNGSYTFHITEPSSYYVAIEVSIKVNVDLPIRGSVTVTRFYYNISNMELSNKSPYSISADNPSCEITICSGYFCHWLKKKYLILQSTGTVTLKYNSYETFLVKSTVLRIVLFSLASVILIVIAFVSIFFNCFLCFGRKARERNDNDREDEESNSLLPINISDDNKNTSSCNVGVMLKFALILTALSTFCAVILVAVSLINSSQPRSVDTDINVGIGNEHPVLLDPNGFKATSSVTVTWTFPRAESIAVYKTSCNRLTTSSAVLPVHYIPNFNITCSNPRNGFNYNQYSIPLNLAEDSNVTYNITVTSSSSKSCSSSSGITCLRLLLMNTRVAYNEFLALHGSSNFTNYVSRSQCLDLQNNSSFTFQINMQDDYYVGIESPYDITVNATVSGVQVYYDTSNLDNVCPDLSISNPSCTVSICNKWMCSKYDEHVCILVNSSSLDEVSYRSSPAILTGISVLLFYAAVGFAVVSVCGLGMVMIPTLLRHSVSMRASIYRKLRKPVNSIWKHKKKYCCFATCGTISLIMLVSSATLLVWNPWKFSKENLIRAKDYVSLDQGLSWPWFAVSDIYLSVQNESDSSDLEIDLFSIPCSEVTTYHLNISHTTKCTDWSGPCKLHEYLYIVRTENVSLNFSITLTTKVEDLQFRLSVFDDDKKYKNFLSAEQYQPLKSMVFNESIAKPFLFNLSYTEMRQQAAYYHIVIHPSVPSHYLQQEANHSQINVQHNGVIGYYNLANFTPIASLQNNQTFTLKDSSSCIFTYSEFGLSFSSSNSTRIFQKSPSDIQSTPYRIVLICIAITVLVMMAISVIACVLHAQRKYSSRSFHRINNDMDEENENLGKNCRQPRPATRSTSHQNVDLQVFSCEQPIPVHLNEQTKETLSSIFGELTELTVDSSGLIHPCSQYGVTLIIPEGAVQQSATVWFGACLFSDKFQFESDYTPATPIVWVYIDCELVKPAELYLPHHIDITSMTEPHKELRLLKADDESVLRENITFKPVPCTEQNVYIECDVIKISLSHFCLACIAHKAKPTPKRYVMARIDDRTSENKFDIDFCFLFDRKDCIETLKLQYPNLLVNDRMLPFTFSENGKLQLEFDPEHIPGWDYYYTGTRYEYITEDNIDFYKDLHEEGAYERLRRRQDAKLYPPRFTLHFEHLADQQQNIKRMTVKVTGTTQPVISTIKLDTESASPASYVNIDLPPKSSGHNDGTPTPPHSSASLTTDVSEVSQYTYRADIAYDVLKTNTSRIKESGIGLGYLADKLADAKIITDSEKSEASDMMIGRAADQRMDSLLTALKDTVKVNGSYFGWFIQVLRDKDTVLTIAIADELVEKYKGHRLNK